MEHLREKWVWARQRWKWWTAKWRDPRTISAFEKVLVASLNNMENLRELHIKHVSPLPSHKQWNCLPLIRKSRLSSLAVLKFSGATILYTDPSVSDVFPLIRDHPLLEHLRLPKGYGNLPFLSTDIACLKSLDAMSTDARMILPGRPVTTLVLRDTPSPPSETWRDLGRSTGPLTRISLPGSLDTSQLTSNLSVMADCLEHLESLSIGTLSFVGYDDVAAVLPAFTRLRDLEIHVKYPSQFRAPDVWDNLELVCTGLRRFCIQRSVFPLLFEWPRFESIVSDG
ncbi:hypothetical protein FRB94_005989 [Tulasnella sp. JGI-2019a]|nr:hypothetical protein FRB94_005989 [Tulasnella sp. JGI-2019a]